MRELRIDIFPATGHSGERFEGLFVAFGGALQLCQSARPFTDAAAELQRLGAPPDLVIAGSFEDRAVSLRATVASAREGFGGPNVLPFSRSLCRLLKAVTTATPFKHTARRKRGQQ